MTDIDTRPTTIESPTVPDVTPQLIGPDTWLIPNLAPVGDEYLFVNSIVILGDEPVVVDTGAPLHTQRWFDAVTSLVDPADVKWIFLSHDDGDHVGGLATMLEAAPDATIVTNFFSFERLNLEPERALPLERMVWLDPGASLDVGDRRLHLFCPPIFDGPTTRGLFDDRSGVMWAVDSFAAGTPGAVYHAGDIPTDLYENTFDAYNSLISPWHAWLDTQTYGRHVDLIEAFGATTIASAHGPVLTGQFISDAFDRVRALAGRPLIDPPDQTLLDERLASVMAPPSP